MAVANERMRRMIGMSKMRFRGLLLISAAIIILSAVLITNQVQLREGPAVEAAMVSEKNGETDSPVFHMDILGYELLFLAGCYLMLNVSGTEYRKYSKRGLGKDAI